VYELTRSKGNALVVQDARVACAGHGRYLIRCPLLDPDEHYVVFGGNGRRPGKGYLLIGRNGKGWLYKVGYAAALIDRGPDARQFFQDLSGLADDLGLVVAGYHRKNREWRGLAELAQSMRSDSGRRWLTKCTMRIFAPADWLVRWRHFFSKKLGFRWIPASDGDPGPTDDRDSEMPVEDKITTASELSRWLRKVGWSQQELADKMRCSRRRVSCHVNGKSDTAAFFNELAELRSRLGR
jgi:hypothetical protein